MKDCVEFPYHRDGKRLWAKASGKCFLDQNGCTIVRELMLDVYEMSFPYYDPEDMELSRADFTDSEWMFLEAIAECRLANDFRDRLQEATA